MKISLLFCGLILVFDYFCAVSIKNDIFPPLLTVSQLLTVSHQKLTLPNLLTPTFNFICYNGPSVLSALFTVPDKPKAPAAAILVASGVGFIHPVHRETGGRRAEVRRTERTSRHHGPLGVARTSNGTVQDSTRVWRRKKD